MNNYFSMQIDWAKIITGPLVMVYWSLLLWLFDMRQVFKVVLMDIVRI